MTDFMKMLEQRSSCRSYADRPVEDKKIVPCINAARFAPSAMNTQPWHFYVANDPDSAAFIAANVQIGNMNGWTGRVPAFVLVTQESAEAIKTLPFSARRDFRPFDIGMAVHAFVLEAAAEGLGACVVGLMDEERLKQRFRISSEKKIALILAVGYPADDWKPGAKKRKELGELVTYVK